VSAQEKAGRTPATKGAAEPMLASEVEAEVYEPHAMTWLAEVGLVTDDEEIDREAFRAAVADALLRHAVAETSDERDAKALVSGELTKLVVPEAEYESGPVAEAAFQWIEKKVWNLAQNTRRGSVIQTLIGDVLPDHVVTTCNVRRGTVPARAVYVTGNADLLLKDFAKEREAKLHAANMTYTADMALLAERIDDLRAKMNRRVRQQLKVSGSQALDQYQLLLGPSNGDSDNGDGSE
jgi:hypothetical protein